VRTWAIANRTSTPCCIGSPVPGYEAPQDTIGPASRVTLALVGSWPTPSATACCGRRRRRRPNGLPAALRQDFTAVREAAGSDLPDDVIVAMIAAWTQLFGMVSFELFGQTRNVIHEHAALFDARWRRPSP